MWYTTLIFILHEMQENAIKPQTRSNISLLKELLHREIGQNALATEIQNLKWCNLVPCRAYDFSFLKPDANNLVYFCGVRN